MGDKKAEGDEREGAREERTSYGQWATVTALIHHEAFW